MYLYIYYFHLFKSLHTCIGEENEYIYMCVCVCVCVCMCVCVCCHVCVCRSILLFRCRDEVLTHIFQFKKHYESCLFLNISGTFFCAYSVLYIFTKFKSILFFYRFLNWKCITTLNSEDAELIQRKKRSIFTQMKKKKIAFSIHRKLAGKFVEWWRDYFKENRHWINNPFV